MENMSMEIMYYENVQYMIDYPQDYKKGEKRPVILFLHGAGSRGNDMQLLADNPYFKIPHAAADFPFVTVAPHCCENTWFDMFETLKGLVRKVATESYTDPKRVYLMGASMGGYAAWQLGMSMPESFAAIVPICGGGMYWSAERLVNVPVWAFHGEKDDVVFVEESIKMTEAVNQWGGQAKLTIYPDNAHDAWSDTYRNGEVFEWMLSHENQNNIPHG